MKIQKFFMKLYICLSFSFSNCDTNEENENGKPTIPLFTEASLETIHGGSQNSWKITEYINIFHDPQYSL